jgi:hypothetical protein
MWNALPPAGVLMCLGLWLGSLAHLLLSVSTLFARFPRAQSDVAVLAAPALFNVSERYHLVLGVIATLLCVGWRLQGCSRARRLAMWLSLAAVIVAAASSYHVTSRINDLRERGLSQTPEFRRLHAFSNGTYLSQTALVLAAFIAATAGLTSGQTPSCRVGQTSPPTSTPPASRA